MTKLLIITADDFGLHEAVNQAVEQAHTAGVLSAASLMMGAPATRSAVRCCKGLPQLRVGLHVVVADGCPVLPPELIPRLLDGADQLTDEILWKSARFFALSPVRQELEAEIRAQFRAFEDTGLRLDHINVHKHMHLHPTVLNILLRVAAEFGTPPIRLPREPAWYAGQEGAFIAQTKSLLLAPWVKYMQHRFKRQQVLSNDALFGMARSGAMDEPAILAALSGITEGVSELYLHPAVATSVPLSRGMQHYRHGDELAALLSTRVRDAVASSGAQLGGYGDIAAMRVSH